MALLWPWLLLIIMACLALWWLTVAYDRPARPPARRDASTVSDEARPGPHTETADQETDPHRQHTG